MTSSLKMTNFITMFIRNFLIIICLVLNSFSVDCYKAEGRFEQYLSRDEDLELEKQLKVLNKPPILSFQKNDGSIIDCIDIHKQPAFDHPLLKNHKLQIQPSSLLAEKMAISLNLDQEVDQKMHGFSKIKFQKCPLGTVPLRRTQKEDLIRAKWALTNYRTMISRPPFKSSDGIQYAGVSTPNPKVKEDKYLGARLGASLHNLTMMIPTQTSTTSLRMGSGLDVPFSSVEYGYTFNQQLYGDTKARTFSLWTADGFQKTGCFNLLCPGFVQVSNIRHMGDEFTYFSDNKHKLYMLFGIIKDPSSGNWWLIETFPKAINHTIGYWPKELFKDNMKDYANVVQAGGKVYNPPLEPAKTPMGNGHFVPNDYLKNALGFLKLVNSSFEIMPKIPMEVLANAPHLYQAQFFDGDVVLFGGPDIQKNKC